MELDEEDVEPRHDNGDKRQDGDVERVEACQRFARHVEAAAQEAFYQPPDEGKIAGSARGDAHRREGPFVPEEKIPAEAEEDGYGEHHETGEPDELPRFPVGFEKKGAEHVDEEHECGELCPQ